jgi:signal transduction histidine kinase
LARLRIEVRELTAFPALDEETRQVLFRVAREALTNVARHARAAHVQITLRADQERAWLEVADDGVGIEADALRKPGSLGLLGIRERLASLAGGMEIGPNAPRGMVLRAWVPAISAEPSLTAE